jgi:nudix-type nucleoside diphosphatase (YffH/AdpP family)
MRSTPCQLDEHGPCRVEIMDVETVWEFGFFKVTQVRLRHERFNGAMSQAVTRINFERGDSVGVLLHDPRDDAVILVRQFRYPAYASLDSEERGDTGARKAWLLEVVAGVLDEGRSVGEVAHRELLEEAGYKVKGHLQYVTTVYPSPGGTSERMYLFLAEVDARRRAGKGGGVAAEGEDVQAVVLPFQEALDMVASGQIVDAKTIILLQHLALLKAGKASSLPPRL